MFIKEFHRGNGLLRLITVTWRNWGTTWWVQRLCNEENTLVKRMCNIAEQIVTQLYLYDKKSYRHLLRCCPWAWVVFAVVTYRPRFAYDLYRCSFRIHLKLN